MWCKKDAYGLLNSIVHVSLVPLSAHDAPTSAALPTVAHLVAVPETVPAALKQVNEPAMYTPPLQPPRNYATWTASSGPGGSAWTSTAL